MNTIAALQISDSGIKVLIGQLDKTFHSWYHNKVEVYLFENNKIDLELLQFHLQIQIENTQRELKKTINSWFFLYDVNDVYISKIMDTKFNNFYVTKSSINDIKLFIEEKAPKKSELVISLVEPVQYKWLERRDTLIKSNVLADIGSRLNNLSVNAIAYRTQEKVLNKMRNIAYQCDINVDAFLPSLFCYSYVLPKNLKRKYVSVVDIGNNSTKIMIYKNNILIDYQVLNIGTYGFTKRIFKKYCINSQKKTVRLIKDYFSFNKTEMESEVISSTYSKAKNEILDLTKGRLRKEGRKQYYKYHKIITEEVQRKSRELLGKKDLPIFVTGGITNAVGYQRFLNKHFPMMQHLDISRVENLDNGFSALLGMIEMINDDLQKSYEPINCVSNQSYTIFSKIGNRISKHTDKLGRSIGGNYNG